LSKRYGWSENYITNLLNPLAVNGMENGARHWGNRGYELQLKNDEDLGYIIVSIK
jgi:hypothetical protein